MAHGLSQLIHSNFFKTPVMESPQAHVTKGFFPLATSQNEVYDSCSILMSSE